MNNLRNKVQLIGRLGMDPEVKVLDSGKKLAKFSIATTEAYKNQKGERVEDTQWHNIIVWERNAEFAEKFLSKGKEIALEGKLSNRTYEDSNGVKRYTTEIIANDFVLFGKK
ncbi:single-stranded DNA-binding protein [Aureivirga sp. CE67]|uniref:single-stranded DNA-binding protein n=1 Tax=Aureivirga sp. CE67 TaxID=1788983 RepID=UPI0018CBDEB9|nr:single-stranded DNA-binding protein [Aureivirga sp. CE67]